MLVILMAMLSCSKAAAQSFEDSLGLQTKFITLHEALEQVLKRSLDVKIEWLNWAVADDQTRAAAGRFNPVLYLNGSYTDSRLPQNAIEFIQTGGTVAPTDGPNLFQQQSRLMEGGVAGVLPTGTRYSVFTTSGRFRNDLNRIRPPGLYYPEYAAAAGVGLTQPLLRDFGPSVQLAEIRVMRSNRAIADYRWEAQLHRVVADVILDYLDLTLVVENIALKRDIVTFARTLVGEVEKRMAEGSQNEELNLQEAQLAVSVAQEDVVKALALAADRQLKLKTQMQDSSAQENGSILLARETPRIKSVPLDRTTLLRTALQKRPDHLSALEEVQRRGILTKYMKNQALPRLDLQATLTTNGLAGSFSSAYDRAANRQGYEAQVGFVFSIPLGNETAKANRATAQHLEQQAVFALARSELNLAAELSEGIARVKGTAARMSSTQKSIDLAEALIESARKASADGLVNAQGLVRTRVQLNEALTRHFEAKVDHSRAVVQLSLAAGTLLSDYGVTLERISGQPTTVIQKTRSR